MKREKLTAARVRKRYTLEEVAELLGVGAHTVYKWEAGKATPRFYNIQKLCDLYEATPWELGLNAERSVVSPEAEATGETLGKLMKTDLTLRLLAIVFEPRRLSYQQLQRLQDKILQIFQEETSMENDIISRREALHRLALLPFATLRLSALGASFNRPIEEILTQCAAGIAACWQLSNSAEGSDLGFAFASVSGYLPTLKAIVKDSSRYRTTAASLVGQCALLQTMLGWHLQGLKEAEYYAQEAVTYSKEAQNAALWVSALDYAAWVYYYAKRSPQALHTVEQAIPLLKQKPHADPLPLRLCGDVYGTLAVMQVKNGQEATTAMGLATEAFFALPIGGPHLASLDFTSSVSEFVTKEGTVHCCQGRPDRAVNALSQLIDAKTLVANTPMPGRAHIQVLHDIARALLKSETRDMERVIHYWKAALEGAMKLRSERHFSEVLVTYEIMESVWPTDKRVKELRDLIKHW
ncbi:MAG: helix-turn-helix transcriptional regulator [Chloroflexi bacterium]|nr:helix-turn-helix transcriptional regulator [Chloroflexota bacterium]